MVSTGKFGQQLRINLARPSIRAKEEEETERRLSPSSRPPNNSEHTRLSQFLPISDPETSILFSRETRRRPPHTYTYIHTRGYTRPPSGDRESKGDERERERKRRKTRQAAREKMRVKRTQGWTREREREERMARRG